MTLSEMSGATFSADRVYRRQLWRRWDDALPWLLLIGCNPSKAGAVESDPTVTRQITRAKLLGCGGLLVCNAYDLVSTDPRLLKTHPAPLSPENDDAILDAVDKTMKSQGTVIAAWGGNVTPGRHNQLLRLLAHVPLTALGVNFDGSPSHPLYISYSVKPEPYGQR